MNTTPTSKILIFVLLCLATFACNTPQNPQTLPLGDSVFLWQDGIGIDLSLPEGFEPSEVQLTLVNEEQRIVIWYKVLDRYFTDYETDYEAKSFEAMNLKMFERKRTMVDGKNALMVVSENSIRPKESHRLRLGMQVESQTVEIDAQYPADIDAVMLETLKKSFLELRQNRSRAENPGKAFDYRLAADSAGFQLVGIAGETALYRSTTSDMDANELLLSVTTHHFPMEGNDTLDFAVEWLQKNLNYELEVEAWDKAEGKGEDRFTLLGLAKGDGHSIQAYQVLWLGKDRIHRLIAMCPDHHEAWLARLEKFAATFRHL